MYVVLVQDVDIIELVVTDSLLSTVKTEDSSDSALFKRFRHEFYTEKIEFGSH